MKATYTRIQIANLLGKNLEEIAIRDAGNYSTHIAVNGTSYCGRLNNDGYNIPTKLEKTTGSLCSTCLKRFESAAVKVGA